MGPNDSKNRFFQKRSGNQKAHKLLSPTFSIALSSLLLAAPFLESAAYPALFVCLIPWLFFLDRTESWKVLIVGSVAFSFLSDAIGLHWIGPAFQEAFGLNAFAVAGILLVFLPLNEIQFLLFAVFYRWIQKRNLLLGVPLFVRVSFLAGAYTAIDALAPKIFGDSLGHGLYGSLWLRQAADIGGIKLLTFVIAFVNFGLFETLKTPASLKARFARALMPTALVAIFACYGLLKVTKFKAEDQDSNGVYRIAVIQGHVAPDLKNRALRSEVSALQAVSSHYLALSEKALALHPETDLVVWPETAYPGVFRAFQNAETDKIDQRIEEFVKKSGKPLIFGTYTRGSRTSDTFNSMIVLRPDGTSQMYRKNLLLPFAEYFPIVGAWEWAKPYLPQQSVAYPQMNLLEIETQARQLKLIPVICYESLSLPHVALGSQKRGDLILNLSEDTWYDSSIQAKQHLHVAAFASVFVGRHQIRATGSGISAWINPLGELQGATSNHAEAVAYYEVPNEKARDTLSGKWGDWFGITCVVATAIAIFLLSLFRRRHAARAVNN